MGACSEHWSSTYCHITTSRSSCPDVTHAKAAGHGANRITAHIRCSPVLEDHPLTIITHWLAFQMGGKEVPDYISSNLSQMKGKNRPETSPPRSCQAG